MKEIMDKYEHKSISLGKNGDPDLSVLSVIEPVDINMKKIDFGKNSTDVFSGEINYKQFSDLVRKNN